jgi:Xaa-Pro dipeptidase
VPAPNQIVARLTEGTLPALQSMLRELGVDGWLLYDFRGRNPIAAAVLGGGIVGTRRVYAWLPAHGVPVVLVHAIDWELWEVGNFWPAAWERHRWVSRAEFKPRLATLVSGRRVAIDYSPNGAIPYLDAVPAGVVESLRSLDAVVVPSVDLVTRFVSAWHPGERASHIRAAAIVADVARAALALAGAAARLPSPMTEHAVAEWIRERFDRAGLVTESGPSVSYGVNAARTHYEPTAAQSAAIVPGALLLLDLWAKEPGGIYADQTWMATVGAPSTRDAGVWETVRSARDAVLDLLRSRAASHEPLRGGDLDRAAKSVIAHAGLGAYIECRTGHSIDAYGLHGFGPSVDDTETVDDRLLVPGVGFSVEPGVYIPGQVGVRSEVNACMGDGEVLVTPSDAQHDLIVV